MKEFETGNQKDKLPWYTFHHDSRGRMIWDILIILFALWNCIYIPIDVAFKPDKGVGMIISDSIIDILFAVDVVVNFMTTYINPKTGVVVNNLTRIVKNYVFRGRFFIDLLASIPFDKLISNEPGLDGEVDDDYSTILGLLKMVRLLRLGRIITFMKFKQGVKIGFRIC